MCAKVALMYFILACFQPNITLFPASSDIGDPLQIRRSQDFYISAVLKLKCAESRAIKTKWTIFNCTLYLNCSIPANIHPSINTTFSEVFVPAKTLTYGLYQFNLIVTMTDIPHLVSLESAYVKINPSGITANLVLYGTSMVTSGEKQDLILDPGQYSINPDDDIKFNASVSLDIFSIFLPFLILKHIRIGPIAIGVDLMIPRIRHGLQ